MSNALASTSDPTAVPLAPEVGPIELDGSLSLGWQTALRLPRVCDIDLDASVVGEGWHGCETAGERPYRWMGGSGTATVVLAVDRSQDLAATFDIFAWRDASFIETIRIAVDDPPHDVPCERTRDSVAFVLPRREHGQATTRIVIETMPGSIIAPDPRPLSVAISRLSIRPLADTLAAETRLVMKAKLSRYVEGLDELAPVRSVGAPDAP